MKRCRTCGEEKVLDAFPRRTRNKDGRDNECSVCRNAYQRAWAKAHPDTALAWQKANRAEAEERVQAWRDRNPAKAEAHRAVRRAVLSGVLVKPSWCEGCGHQATSLAGIQGHHDDYSRPLEVVWLCPTCHKARHRVAERALSPQEEQG